jgi:hypothetical protein
MPPPLPHYETSPRPHNRDTHIHWGTATSSLRQERDDKDEHNSQQDQRPARQGILSRRSSPKSSTIRHQYRYSSNSDEDHYGLYNNGASSSYESIQNTSNSDGPITIRPAARFMPHHPPVDPIPLDQLSPQDRDLYLRDFLPPVPPIATKPVHGSMTRAITLTKVSSLSNSSNRHQRHHHDENNSNTENSSRNYTTGKNAELPQVSPRQPSSAGGSLHSTRTSPPQQQQQQQKQPPQPQPQKQQDHSPWPIVGV